MSTPQRDLVRVYCLRCWHTLVDEDDVGWYYQVPVTDPAAPGLTFMDRVHRCEGLLHRTDPGVVRHVREQRKADEALERDKYIAWLRGSTESETTS